MSNDSAHERWIAENPNTLEAQLRRAQANPVDPMRSAQEQYDRLPQHVRARIEAGEVATTETHEDGETTTYRPAIISPGELRIDREIRDALDEQVRAVAANDPIRAAKVKMKLDTLAVALEFQRTQDAAEAERHAQERDTAEQRASEDVAMRQEYDDLLDLNARRARLGIPPAEGAVSPTVKAALDSYERSRGGR